MTYKVEGTLLEVCTCEILCPCWVGEDPDNPTCDSIMAYHVDKGSVDGTDLSGRTLALLCDIPGNVMKGNWKVAVFVDDGATDEQQEAMVSVWTGKLGGPIADLAALVGEVVSVERVPITYEIEAGRGTIKIGSVAEADMEPFRGPTGDVTTLNESIFTTIPGTPAWVAKAGKYIRKVAKYGLRDTAIEGHNAIQGTFRFEG